MKREITQQQLWYYAVKKEVPDLVGRTVISPMHYGDTVEIHLNRGFRGEAIINGEHFLFREKNIYFIPPRCPHSYIYTQGGSGADDMIFAFHINLEMLKPILDIEKMLQADNRTLLSYSIAGHDFDAVWRIITDVIKPGQSLPTQLSNLIRLFDLLKVRSSVQKLEMSHNPSVIKIMDWVEHGYADKLTVQKAAEHFNFSSCYFCKWFRKQTGITFNEYLSAVRITHACTFLQKGLSVSETAQRCGYSDPSYFVKVFRRFLGITPLEYATKSKQMQISFLN